MGTENSVSLPDSGPEEKKLKPEEEKLHLFLSTLWEMSREKVPAGAESLVERKDPILGELPPLRVPLEPLIQKSFETWKRLTNHVLVGRKTKLTGITASDRDITYTDDVYYPKPPEIAEEEGDTILLKSTKLGAVFDFGEKAPRFFPPDPLQGTPQIKLSAFEVFNDTERELKAAYAQLIDLSEEKAQDFQRRVSLAITGTLPSGQITPEEFEKIEELRLTVLEVVGRNIFFDKERASAGTTAYQPINVVGFKIEKKLGVVNAYSLAPWIRHNHWEPFSLGEQDLIGFAYDSVEKTLEQKFRFLGRVITG